MIEIRDLYVGFQQRSVLAGVNLRIEDGRTTVILGRSGIGKSVLLKAILGLVPIQRGSILFQGEDLLTASRRRQEDLRSRIGMLLQNGGLFDSLNVFDNIAFPLRYHRLLPESDIQHEVERYASLVDLGPSLHLFPQDLSGGMRRRAALARAIIQKPDVLFYDEPTTGLDPSTSALVELLIRRIRDELKVTTLIVTHDIEMVQFLGETIALLQDGQIIACQDRQEALSPGSLIKESFISAREKAHRDHGY